MMNLTKPLSPINEKYHLEPCIFQLKKCVDIYLYTLSAQGHFMELFSKVSVFD